jgi:hypothetical protein
MQVFFEDDSELKMDYNLMNYQELNIFDLREVESEYYRAEVKEFIREVK